MIKYREAEEMKDSGVEWLGMIPRDWDGKKLKYSDKVIMGQSPSSDNYNDLNVGNPFLQGNADFTSLHPEPSICCETAKKHAVKNDVLLSVRAPIGAVNIADQKYGIGRGLCVIRAIQSMSVLLFYVMLSLNEELKRIGKGSTYTAISVADVENMFVPSIPPIQQQKISNYLDIKTAQLDRVIEGKEKLIAKLEEAKKSLISEVVTGKVKIADGKLVDRDLSEMKDSGVGWLGMVPKEWESARFKRCLKVVSGKEILDAEKEIEKKIEVYGSGGVFKATSEILYKGESVLFGRKGTIGKPLFVNGEFWTVDTMYYTTYKKDAYPRFFYYQFLIFPWVLITTQTTLPSIVGSEVENLPTVFPSRVEMEMISAHLDKKLQKLEVLEYKTTQQIQKLKQAKQSLISEAVTGKIDLRDWEIQDIGE